MGALVGLLAWTAAAPAQAATIDVGCGAPALVTAINAANSQAGPDTLRLAPDCLYTLNTVNNNWYGPNGLPAISSTITIEGNGATIQRFAMAPKFRFFFVGADPARSATANYTSPGAGNLTLHELTLTGGLARGGSASAGGAGAGLGGAIFNQGRLTLDAVTVTQNEARGGDIVGRLAGTVDFRGGGGIGEDVSGFNGGGFGSGSFGGATGGAGGEAAIGAAGGGGGGGGFIAADNGGNGGDGGSNPDFSPRYGSGGAGGGAATGLGGSGVTGNFGDTQYGAGGRGGAGSGGGAGGGPTGQEPIPGSERVGGGFGQGGSGGTTPNGSGGGGVGGGGGGPREAHSLADFQGGGGGGGFGGGGGAAGGSGGFGGGGGAANREIDNTSLASVIWPAGVGGFGGGSGNPEQFDDCCGGTGAGMGGAVFNMQGELKIVNSTLAGNVAAGGTCSAAGSCGTLGKGLGGAIFNLSGTVEITFSTLADNGAPQGGGALYNLGYDSAIQRFAELVIRGSILAFSRDAVTDLVSDAPSATTAGANEGEWLVNLFGTNSIGSHAETGKAGIINGAQAIIPPSVPLGALADNGGPTPTMAIPTASPYRNSWPNASCDGLVRDQRGAARPQGGNCDLGAVEVDTTAPLVTLIPGQPPLTNDQTPSFTFSSNEPGTTFECRLDSPAGTPCTSPLTLGVLADGDHTLEVVGTDIAGNSSSALHAFTVDTTPPQTTIDSGPTGAESRPAFAFSSSDPSATFQCRHSRIGSPPPAFAACSGPGNSATIGPLGSGEYVFEVRATDAAGNPDATPASVSFRVAEPPGPDPGPIPDPDPGPTPDPDPGPNPDPACTVPQIKRGAGLRAARRKLIAAGCAAGKVSRRHSAKVKRGRLIRLKPKPGTVLPAGGTVAIVLSAGPR